jgi:TP901 family phage tail tape measure protein
VASSFRTAVGSVTSGFGKVGETISMVARKQRELNAIIKEQEKLGDRANRATLDAARKQSAALSEQMTKLKAVTSLERKLHDQRARLGNAINSTGRAVAGATVAAVPVVGAMKRGADQDFEMLKVQLTQDLSAEQRKELEAKITAVSRERKVSIGDVTKAYAGLSAGGMDAKTAMATVGDTIKGANAMFADIGDVTQLHLAAGKILGLSAQRVNDVVHAAGKAGSFEAAPMSQYLPGLMSGSKTLGMTGAHALASNAAQLQVVRDASGSDAEAATKVSNLQSKFLDGGTIKAAKAMGFDPLALQREAEKSGGDFVKMWVEAAKKATGGRAELVQKLLPDKEARAGFNALSDGIERYVEITDKAVKSQGQANAAAAEVERSRKREFESIGQAADGLFTQIGSSLNRALGDGKGGTFASKINQAEDWVKANEGTAGTIAQVAGAVGGFVLVTKGGKAVWEAGKTAVDAFKWATDRAKAPVGKLETATKTLGDSADGAKGKVGGLTGVLGKLGLAFAAFDAAKSIWQLGSAAVDLHKAKNHEGVKLSADAQQRINAGELGGPKPAQPGALGSGALALPAPVVTLPTLAPQPKIGATVAQPVTPLKGAPTPVVTMKAPAMPAPSVTTQAPAQPLKIGVTVTQKPAEPAKPVPVLPQPAMAAPRAAQPVQHITNNQTIHLKVDAKGADAKAVAKEVKAELARDARAAKSSRMFDGAAA